MSGYDVIQRGAVNAWDCDIMGHMNVRFYTARLVEGLAHVGRAVGLDGTELRLRHSRIQHKRELRAGEPFRIEAAIQAVGGDGMELHARLVAEADEALAADYTIHLDCRLDDAALSAAEALIVPRAESPRPSVAGTPSEPATAGLAEPFLAARGTAEAWEMDHAGRLAPGYMVSLVMSAIGPLRRHLELGAGQLGEARIGTAALEYDIRYLGLIRSGEKSVWCGMLALGSKTFRFGMRIENGLIRSGEKYSVWCGMLALGSKTFRFGMRIENDSSDQTAGIVEVVNCMFDLEARRALPMPDRQRALAEALIVPWPPEIHE